MIQLSQSLQDAYPVHESGVTFHAFHPQFIRTPMTRVLDEGKLVKLKLRRSEFQKLLKILVLETQKYNN